MVERTVGEATIMDGDEALVIEHPINNDDERQHQVLNLNRGYFDNGNLRGITNIKFNVFIAINLITFNMNLERINR